MNVRMTGLGISAIDFDLQWCYFSGDSGAHIKSTSMVSQSQHNSLDKQSWQATISSLTTSILSLWI